METLESRIPNLMELAHRWDEKGLDEIVGFYPKDFYKKCIEELKENKDGLIRSGINTKALIKSIKVLKKYHVKINQINHIWKLITSLIEYKSS